MKISVNDQKLYELSDVQKKVIQNDIPDEIFESDMKRRLEWALMHKYECCFESLKKEWEPILAKRMDSVPTNPDAFANLVFSQPDYKSRSKRDLQAKNEEHLRRTGQL